MVDRANGRKISNFIASETLPSGAYFDFISEGVNYKISKADLETAFGINAATPYALGSLQGNATNTVIVTQSTPVLVAGTWTAQLASGFTVSAGGRLTYTGTPTKLMSIDAAATVDAASGTNKNCILYIAKNGAVIAGSALEADVSAGVERQMSSVWLVSLSTNDYIELFIANDTDTVDLLVKRAVLRAR